MIDPLRSCLATNTDSDRDCDPDSDADTDSGSSTAVFMRMGAHPAHGLLSPIPLIRDSVLCGGKLLSMIGIMATDSQSSDRSEDRGSSKVEDSPPPFSTWNRLYAAVVIYTLILVAALYWMTAALNR